MSSRRISLKHTARTKHTCPIQFCTESFYRTDKLRAHLWRSHKDEEAATCPIPNCGGHGLPWILLGLHMRNRYFWSKQIQAVLDPSSRQFGDERSCPIQSCQREHITVRSMREHLQTHDAQERIENGRSILEAGYDAISAKITCTVCQSQWGRQEDFESHAEIAHIATDLAHLRNFRRSTSQVVFWRYAEQPYELFWPETSRCCSMTTHPRHHLEFLHDPEILRPYRMTLLRLWPELGTHPIFDDVMRDLQRPDKHRC
jgi:hypothetical protein